MKSTIQRVLIAAAVVTLGAGALGTASAQTTTTTTPSSAPGANPQGPHHGHRHFGGGSPFVGTLLRATQQLNLTVTQQQSIKTILQGARATGGQHPGQGPDMTVLGNPAHPDFAAAVQSAATGASVRVQKESTLAGEIYGVLSTQQKQQLPTVLAAMQAKQQARRAQWAAQHPNSNG